MKQKNPAFIGYGDDVKITQRGGVGVITLNRPEALNALSLDMVRTLSAALKHLENDNSVSAVFIKGAGGRAFCAGGDIKALHKAGMEYRRGGTNIKVPALFFAEEYMLNKQIYNYPKPIIGFMNGITMGGGYGIAGNCKYRVVTDRTVFAMPEVGIGFFPDVGSLYHLMGFKDFIGHYLALTGEKIGAEDAYYAGVGEYYIESSHEDVILDALAKHVPVDQALSAMATQPDSAAPMEGKARRIKAVFAHESVEDILKALETDGSVWASGVFEIMHEKSPSSICVTAEYIRRARGKTVDEILDMDFHLAQKFIERSDLYEGIRRAVIDKHAQPVWDPASLKNVTEEHVNEYFISTGYDLSDM